MSGKKKRPLTIYQTRFDALADLIVIEGVEPDGSFARDGEGAATWAFTTDERETARHFWEALKTETESQGKSARFVDTIDLERKSGK